MNWELAFIFVIFYLGVAVLFAVTPHAGGKRG